MGRPGRSGGGSHRSSSSSRSHRSSSRSHSSSRSSFSSRPSRPSGGFGGGYGGGYGGGPRPPRPPRPPRTHHHHYYYGGSTRRSSGSSGGCGTMLASMIIAFIVIILLVNVFAAMGGNSMQFSSNTIDEDVVFEQAELEFGKINDESSMLLYYAYSESMDADTAQLFFGNNIPVEMLDEDDFWEIYDNYYYSDATEGEWLGGTFKDLIPCVNGTVEAGAGYFVEGCIDDQLDWLSNSDRNECLNDLEKFYKSTGIQPYIVLVDYEELPGVVISTGNNSTALKVFIGCVTGVVVLILIIGWWKKSQQAKKEEREATERMLNTPLETFGDTTNAELNDLIDKYDVDKTES